MQQALANIRYGADPELFLCRVVRQVAERPAKTPDSPPKKFQKAVFVPVPVTGLIGGTKQNPLPVKPTLPGWESSKEILGNTALWVQEDGAAVEFNVSPAHDVDGLLYSCSAAVEAIRAYSKEKGLRIHKEISATFEESYLKSHPAAFEVGCDPDFDAYTGSTRPVPEGINRVLTRHAGGHIHVGYDKELVPPHIVVQFMDLFLGLPSVGIDTQGLRRQFYGQPGAFREKAYGVEYRTLSNFWVPGVKYSYDMGFLLLSSLENFMRTLMTDMKTMERLYRTIPWDLVQTAIRTESKGMAETVLTLGYRTNPDLFERPLNFLRTTEQQIARHRLVKA